jgi:hypothetical protein
MSFRLKAIKALEQRSESITYRDLTELLWTIHPAGEGLSPDLLGHNE